MIKIIVSIVMISSLLAFTNSFVLGTYNIKNTKLLTCARDSLLLNTIRTSWLDSQDSIEEYLAVAEKKELNIILGDAGIDENPRLSRYFYIWKKLWESDSNYVFHNTGCRVSDSSASNNYAWSCQADQHQHGLMQYGPSGWQAQIQTHYTKPFYTARFRLKINPEMGYDTTKVCSLIVLSGSKPKAKIVANTVLKVEDFPKINMYSFFDLDFTKSRNDRNAYQYLIWWFGSVDLWSDYVEINDDDIDLLIKGQFDDSLNAIFANYQQFTALTFFYLKDEPLYGQFASNKYIMNYLREYHHNTPGIQALGAQGKEYFRLYSNIVKPHVLLFDTYPIRHDTPYSGPIFQQVLDGLCEQLSDMRTISLAETLNFWFIVQAYGRYESSLSDDGGHAKIRRLPTSEELNCMTWLALAYGAKGIFYYCFESRSENNCFLRGLWRFDNRPREPLFSQVKELNKTLSVIGRTLVNLKSDYVFKSESVPNGCLINTVKPDSAIQIGVFHNAHNDTFLIIVNRCCRPFDVRTVTISTKRKYVFIKDVYTGDFVFPYMVQSNYPHFTFHLKPGEGRCFELVP